MKRRRICICLLFGLLLSLVSCGTTERPEIDDSTSTAIQEPDTPPETDPLSPYLEALTVKDYDGYSFRIMNSSSNFAYSDVVPEEITGEALNDAVYNRNLAVCDALNISLVNTEGQWANGITMTRAFIQANSDEYDICCNEAALIAPLALEGLLQDGAKIDSVHLENPWWDQNAISSANLGDTRYLLWGNMHLMLYECYYPVLVNKTYVENASLTDPYTLVREGKWTFDVMHSYMETALQDINGDGKYVAGEDHFGLAIFDHGATSFFTAADTSLFSMDEKHMPVFRGLTERYEAVFSKLSSTIFQNKDNLLRTNTPAVASLDSEARVHDGFGMGGAMFYVEPLGSVKKFRNVDFEVGVLPMPKYEETQSEYISYIYHGADAVTIPVTNRDTDRTGVILEMFGARSHTLVIPVYFDTTLAFKYIQDAESKEMLDIMFANGRFDLGSIYKWGGITEAAYGQLFSKSPNLASKITALTDKTNAAVQETIDTYLAAAQK